MFAFRATVQATSTPERVDVAFTDSTLDLQGPKPGFAAAMAQLGAATGIGFARLHQVHGDHVHLVTTVPVDDADAPVADAQVTTLRGVGLMVRTADCVPVVLADAAAGVIAVAHAGRPGMAVDVVTRTIEVMGQQGATDITAWIGPHVCGACYEVPAEMRAEVTAVVPESYSETSWGTPALDIGAGVRAQLIRAGVQVVDVGGCTLEEQSLHSYRRDASSSGRGAGLVWIS